MDLQSVNVFLKIFSTLCITGLVLCEGVMAHKMKRKGFKPPELDLELPLGDDSDTEFTGESSVQAVLFCASESKYFNLFVSFSPLETRHL